MTKVSIYSGEYYPCLDLTEADYNCEYKEVELDASFIPRVMAAMLEFELVQQELRKAVGW